MKKIVCPIDFSPASMNALEYAFKIAHKFKTQLVLFHSIHPKPQEALSEGEIFEKEEMIKEKLEKICEAHASTNNFQGINYWFLVRTGLASDAILQLIKDNEFDMVIMGSKGAEGIEEILGTLSAEIAEKSPCPVIIIPENYPYQEIKTIVMASDLKGNDEGTLNYVINLAKTFQAHISILHIQKKRSEDVEKVISQGENMLLEYPYSNASFHVAENENVIEGINVFGETHKADLIVMASSDRTLLQKLFYKSQTRQMAYHTKIPLLSMHKEKA